MPEQVIFSAQLTSGGDVELTVTDRSASAEAAFGASAHFHSVLVPAEHKDALLVALLRDRFGAAEPFRGEAEYEAWLRARGIEPRVECDPESA